MQLRFSRQVFLVFVLVVVSASISFGASDMTPEVIVAKHLASLGSAEARKDMKSRVVQSAATYRIIVGGSGAIDGKSVIATEGQKANYLFKINATAYHGEQFIFDGNRMSIAGTYNDKTRSEFADFLLGQDVAIRENLLAGVWSAGWPLLDVEGRKPKLHYEGIKKVEGRELIALHYQPKKGTDLDITLFFDPQTYQHVRTTYKATRAGGIGATEVESSQKQLTRYLMEERFSDFHAFDGLTLPTRYDLRFTEELDNGFTKTVEWDVKAANIMNNISIDPRSFQVK